MDIRQKTGKRIQELRKQNKGISQESLAGIAGIDRTYMTSVENGKRNISIINLEKIIKALDVTLKEFFNSPIFND